MAPAHIDYRRTLQVILSLAAGCLFIMAMNVSVRAAETKTFVIPTSDGYGIHECLTPGSSCGQVVADAWCEAHGLDKSVAFGPAEDVTASIGTSDAPKIAPGSIIVSCQE